MSHFTNMKTRFQNLFYLEKALTRLNIQYKKQIVSVSNGEDDKTNLVIAQPNGYDISFCWNGQEYDLVADMSYWKQPYPVESFIDKIGQQYAGETIIGESQKIGFQPIKSKQHVDGSNTITLQRWNLNNSVSLV